jgi:benzil reductase ((S)-benzoin forming)
MNVLITGCSSGLGFGLANHYLDQGHRVFGISRSANDTLNSKSGFRFLSQDLADFEGLRRRLNDFLQNESSLDLVILNAAMLNDIKDMKDTEIEEIRQVMNVNVYANKVLIDVLFESLDSVRQVVAISSGAAVSGSRGWNAYSLSKACLNMLIDLYAKERRQTHFCTLAPGLIETGMQDYINTLAEEYEQKFPLVKKLKEARGTGKMPKPHEAAEIVADSVKKAVDFDSGSFLDVREM